MFPLGGSLPGHRAGHRPLAPTPPAGAVKAASCLRRGTRRCPQPGSARCRAHPAPSDSLSLDGPRRGPFQIFARTAPGMFRSDSDLPGDEARAGQSHQVTAAGGAARRPYLRCCCAGTPASPGRGRAGWPRRHQPAVPPCRSCASSSPASAGPGCRPARPETPSPSDGPRLAPGDTREPPDRRAGWPLLSEIERL